MPPPVTACARPIVALVFTFIYYWLRGLIKFEKSMESIPNGFIQMISILILLLRLDPVRPAP